MSHATRSSIPDVILTAAKVKFYSKIIEIVFLKHKMFNIFKLGRKKKLNQANLNAWFGL